MGAGSADSSRIQADELEAVVRRIDPLQERKRAVVEQGLELGLVLLNSVRQCAQAKSTGWTEQMESLAAGWTSDDNKPSHLFAPMFLPVRFDLAALFGIRPCGKKMGASHAHGLPAGVADAFSVGGV